jgi:hypothetical protein
MPRNEIAMGPSAAYFVLPIIAAVFCVRLRTSSPALAGALGAMAFTMSCQFALYILHLNPLETSNSAPTLLLIANRLPFVAVVLFPLLLRSGWRGGIGAAIGVGLGFACAAVLQHLLGLVKLRLY